MIHHTNILVLGGAGSIGSELARQLTPNNNVYIFDNNETAYFDLIEELKIDGQLGDIRDVHSLETAFKRFKPHLIFHCAALKHVTPSMQFPREYINTNLLGTLNALDLSKKYGGKFVNVSTDKAVQRHNVMGWSKHGTELFTRIYGGISVRFGNVLGSRGSVIPIWQKQIDSGKPVTITDPRMERYVMKVEEAVELVIEAAERGQAGDIYILDMTNRRINVLELAKRIISETGRDVPIKVIGSRPGEALFEEIMTHHEQETAIKEGKFFVLRDESRKEDPGTSVSVSIPDAEISAELTVLEGPTGKRSRKGLA